MPAMVAGAQTTLVADAHVSSARPSINAGTLTNLNVGGGYTALLRFDLSMLPTGTTAAQVTRAALRVYCNRADTPGLVAVQPVGGAWAEYGVTYATLPVLGAAVQTAQVSDADSFVIFDVTATVQGWIAGTTSNNGVALTAGSAVLQFDSKENDETGHAAELQIVLAAGGVGTQGPVGAQGLVGPQGLAGLNGAQGPAGPQGLHGFAGATGPAGPAGIQGPAGTGGTGSSLSYQGTYSSVTNYALSDVVTFAGSSYLSLTANNHGNTPGFLAGTWGLLASVGDAGAMGVTGATGSQGQQGPAGLGVQGPVGPQGLAGVAGVAGKPGLVYQGVYASTINYALGDVWRSKLRLTAGLEPWADARIESGKLGSVDGAGTAGGAGCCRCTGSRWWSR